MNKLYKKKLLHIALCGIISGAAGCKSESAPPVVTERDWQGAACTDNSVDLLTGLNATEDIDGLVIYRVGQQTGPFTQVFGGEPCARALDVQSCQALLTQASENYSHEPSLIVTSGNEVRAIQGESQVLAFLGDIDTPQKALLWMQIHNMNVACDAESSAVASASDGQSWYGLYVEMVRDCAPIVNERVEVRIGIDGSIVELNRVEVSRFEGACVGRRPPGSMSIVQDRDCLSRPELGSMFARHAAYEAASVVAFTHLKAELEHYGAPAALTGKILDAANDEVRHAQQVEALANRYGCDVEGVNTDPGVIRSLEDIALDNLREGCVGETWGALVGLYQADHARDEQVRQTMRDIAVDEVGHAALSWEIHRWLHSQLSPSGRRMLDAEVSRAFASLKFKVESSAREGYELVAGLPSIPAATEMLSQLKVFIEQNSADSLAS